MPRGSKVAPATRRQWLEDQEQGVPVAKIAAGSGRSARTVTGHIELARQEKAHREVRSGLIREAYQRHSNDLMELAQTLRRNGPGAAIDRRTTLLREALQHHIPESPLWQACKEWEEAARKSDELTQTIKGHLTRVVEGDVHGRFPEVTAEGFRESLLHVMRVTAEEGSLSNMIYSTGREELGHSASWGQFQLCEAVLDEERLADILELHQELVREMVGSGYVKQMKAIADQGAKAREMVDREVEMLILSHMVPGACPLCPGDEVARARGRRKGL